MYICFFFVRAKLSLTELFEWFVMQFLWHWEDRDEEETTSSRKGKTISVDASVDLRRNVESPLIEINIIIIQPSYIGQLKLRFIYRNVFYSRLNLYLSKYCQEPLHQTISLFETDHHHDYKSINAHLHVFNQFLMRPFKCEGLRRPHYSPYLYLAVCDINIFELFCNW